MRKSGESVKKIQFWLIISFKKTQKQRCSELNSLHMIANGSPNLLTLQRSMAPNTSSKSAQEISTKFSHFFCQEGKLHRYDTTLLMNLTKAPQKLGVSSIDKKTRSNSKPLLPNPKLVYL